MPKFRMSLLLCITLVLSLVIASDAKAFDSPHQVNHNRFLKKRAPIPQLIPGGSNPQPVIGAGANPTISGTGTTQSVSTETAAASTSSSSSSSSSSSTSATTTTSGGLVGTIVSGLLPTTTTSSSVSSSSSTSSSSSPSTQSSSSSSSVAQTPAAIPSTAAIATQVVSPTSASVVYITDTSSAGASASATPSSSSSSSTGITHTAIIVLIVIAASVGGSIIIWTIIRKWKFGKSSNFDDRMQPIDWHPSTDDSGDIPGMNRRYSNASSFHSGSGHGSGATVLNPIPDHDFTAGAANLAPVGGYADLSRGPSPQPMMQELARGPSFSHQYQSDPFGVPLHHGGYGTGY